MRITTLLAGFFLTTNLLAQVEMVSIGPSYANFTYYELQTGDQYTFTHDVWDIAFTVEENTFGIHVNEAKELSMSTIIPEVELYSSSSTDFETADTSMILDRLYNEEINWATGAFNTIADEGNPDDFGWGQINPLTGEIEGSVVYFIKPRNDVYYKLKIDSYSGSEYHFRYALLDGSSEQTVKLNTADYSGKTLAYYSIENNEAKDLEPENWDLLFTRYYAGIDDGTQIVQYLVGGVLSNEGLPIAQADGIDPSDVDHNDYADAYEENIDLIGHDWKSFDLGSFKWVVVTDRVYFIETSSTIWQILFLDFAGSSTGMATFEKTDLLSSSVSKDHLLNLVCNIYPNPSSGALNISMDGLKDQAKVDLLDMHGKVIAHLGMITNGVNSFELGLNLNAGIYLLRINTSEGVLSKYLQVLH